MGRNTFGWVLLGENYNKYKPVYRNSKYLYSFFYGKVTFFPNLHKNMTKNSGRSY